MDVNDDSNSGTPITHQSIAQILHNTAVAVREVVAEFPEAVRKGPTGVSEVLMKEGRRVYIGIALAVAALVLIVFA